MVVGVEAGLVVGVGVGVLVELGAGVVVGVGAGVVLGVGVGVEVGDLERLSVSPLPCWTEAACDSISWKVRAISGQERGEGREEGHHHSR